MEINAGQAAIVMVNHTKYTLSDRSSYNAARNAASSKVTSEHGQSAPDPSVRSLHERVPEEDDEGRTSLINPHMALAQK